MGCDMKIDILKLIYHVPSIPLKDITNDIIEEFVSCYLETNSRNIDTKQ